MAKQRRIPITVLISVTSPRERAALVTEATAAPARPHLRDADYTPMLSTLMKANAQKGGPLTIYLAGPDVFVPNAVEIGRRKKELCREFGFEGLFPADNEADAKDAATIFKANCALMSRADAGFFNLTPFRGPSADPGTVFELGYMFAGGKPLFGYSSVASTYRHRVESDFGPISQSDGRPFDRHGLAVEDFGLTDNLMIARSIEESGGAFVSVEEAGGSNADTLVAIEAFRACLHRLKQR
jgi:nucleoside 2-deoxyribosyltransferase